MPKDPDLSPIQRYVIAWTDRQRASDRMIRAQSRMVADEMDVRLLLARRIELDSITGRARYGWHIVTLLGGERFKVSFAPNGLDIMVLPWAE